MGCGPCCMLCVFSSIASPGMMDLQNEVLVAFRQSDHSSASAHRRCNLCVGKLQPLGRKHLRRGVVGRAEWRHRAGKLLWSCWGRLRMSLVIATPWIRSWFGKTLAEFPRFAFLRCLVSLSLCHSEQMA